MFNSLDKTSRCSIVKTLLLLFYPYRIQDDLLLNESYWEKYKYVMDNNIISTKSIEIIQNIQDVCHNCSKLKQAKDELETTTVYTPHENDDKRKEVLASHSIAVAADRQNKNVISCATMRRPRETRKKEIFP